jgi:hypothetical protein
MLCWTHVLDTCFVNEFGVSLFFFSVFLLLFFSFALIMRPAKAYFGFCLYFQVFMK